jgi:hypothetical protein
LPGPDGRRPVNGSDRVFGTDPVWSDNLMFHEYFHGDTGAGLGATHQTGWTALVADLLLDPPGASSRIFGERGPADPAVLADPADPADPVDPQARSS